MNNVTLSGRLTKEPDVRYGGENNSVAIARFTLAVYDYNSTDFINIRALGKTAEWVEKWLQKGNKIELVGKIKTGHYTGRDGKEIYYTEVLASSVSFGETKAEAQQRQQAAGDRPQPTPSDGGFMDIPDGYDGELPLPKKRRGSRKRGILKVSEIRLNEDELEQIITTAAKKGVEIYKREEQKKHKADKYHDTFSLMRCYRDAVFHRENAVSEAAQLQQQGELTEEQQATYLRSIRRTRFKTILMLDHIDKAVEEIERRRQQQGREVEYKAFELYFMQGLDYADIAEELNTGKNTPRRWISGIINELSVLLWGIDEDSIAQ